MSDAWTVRLTAAAQKAVNKLPTQERLRIGRALRRLAQTGRREGDYKKLKGKPESWRLRVGDWRIIIIEEPEQTLTVTDIRQRQEGY